MDSFRKQHDFFTMNSGRLKQAYLFAVPLCLATSLAQALPFSITPTPDSPFPTVIASGTTVFGSYIVRNNTSTQRNGNYVKYLPPNVSILDSGCSPGFNLAPFGQPGDNCTLNLAITGEVLANGIPQQSLFVCFPGGRSCAGTPNPLSVATLYNASVSGFSAVAHYGNKIFLGGMNSEDYGTLWELAYHQWKAAYTGSVSSPIKSIQAVDPGLIYFAGDSLGSGVLLDGWVYSFNPLTKVITDTGFNSTTAATDVSSLTYGNNVLYAGGIDNTGIHGQVWSYVNGTWTSTNISDPNLTSVLALTFAPTLNKLFDSVINNGASTLSGGSYAQVQYFNGTQWVDTGLPTSDNALYLVEVDTLVADNAGNIYAGGFDSNYNAAVWKYNGTTWSQLNTPSLGGEIYSLAFNNNGVLYAGGFDGVNFVGQVWYYSNGNWVSTHLMGSSSVYDITIDSTNLLYAVGIASNSASGVWSINANA